jgi:hypothetical protein
VIIDLGYDWSGDPGVPRTLSLLPFNPLQNWPAVAVKLVAATIQGIQAFLGDLGGLPTLVPATVAPTSNTPVSTFAAARMTATTEPTETTETTEPIETTEKVSETEKSTLRLTLVKDPETTVQQTAVETGGSSADETPVAKPEDKPVTKLEEATEPASTADEKKSDDKKDDAQKDATDADATDKDANEKKTDTDKKVDVDKKTDTDNKADTDKKDADSAKAAA